MFLTNLHSYIKYMLIVLFVLLGIASLTSCSRKELCYHHYRAITVTLEWEREWERDHGDNHRDSWNADLLGYEYADFVPDISEGVTILIYNLEDKSIRYQFVNTDHGTFAVGSGANSIMLFSNDTEYVEFDDMADPIYAHVQTTARSRVNFVSFANEPTVSQPDMVYGAYLSHIDELGDHEELKLDVKMQPLVYTYVLKIPFDHGLEHIALARGALSGMARGTYLRSGGTTEETATILIDECEIAADGIIAVVRSFGPPGILDKSYGGPWQEYVGMTSDAYVNSTQCFNLEVRLTQGAIKEYYFDVTDRIKQQPSGGVVHMEAVAVEDGENIGSGSAFDVNVNGWDTVVDLFPDVAPVA
jgi:hypothetical protein